MATRTIIQTMRAIWGGDFNTLLNEHNKLVDEVEDLKSHYKSHYHSAATSSGNIASGGSGTFGTPTLITTEAQKVT